MVSKTCLGGEWVGKKKAITMYINLTGQVAKLPVHVFVLFIIKFTEILYA